MGIHNIVVENLEYKIPFTCRNMSKEEEARMLKLIGEFYSHTKQTESKEDEWLIEERREIQYQLNTKFFGLTK